MAGPHNGSILTGRNNPNTLLRAVENSTVDEIFKSHQLDTRFWPLIFSSKFFIKRTHMYIGELFIDRER